MGSYYRRSPRLVAYWRDERFLLHPYESGPAFDVDPDLVRLLDGFSSWTTIDWFQEAAGLSRRAARRLLEPLVVNGILLQSHRRLPPPKDSPWDTWGEAASFLHFSTRDQAFLPQPRAQRLLADRARQSPPPAPLKSYAGRRRLALPEANASSPFHEVLHARRTWRQFGTRPVALDDLAGVLQATFGVQRWMDLGHLGRLMLRSSPSGGARHPIEAYVLARRIDGLKAGAYYYAPAEHALVPLAPVRVTSSVMTRMLGGQSWFGGAAALVVLTAVFARKAWAYRSARAYRSLLLEAGHFGQTLCLVATARHLAPFCTGAFRESLIEGALGLRGDEEAVVYVTGLGSRPPGARWAPLPAGEAGLGE